MNKKFYVQPSIEVCNAKVEGTILAGSGPLPQSDEIAGVILTGFNKVQW